MDRPLGFGRQGVSPITPLNEAGNQDADKGLAVTALMPFRLGQVDQGSASLEAGIRVKSCGAD